MSKRLWVVPILISLNVGIFVYQALLTPGQLSVFERFFGLSKLGMDVGRWWGLFTHSFLHSTIPQLPWEVPNLAAKFQHVVFNMLGLWFAGRIVERTVGSWRFLALYVTSALAGGVFQLEFGGPGLLIGASGAVFGVMLAFTTLYPDWVVLIFFVLPLRAKYFAWFLTLSSLAALIFRYETWIGHAAHLGGAVAGTIFGSVWRRRRPRQTPAGGSGSFRPGNG